MNMWGARLLEAVLRVPDPSDAAEYYARLLGGEPDDGGVALAAGTRLALEPGEPGFAWAGFDSAGLEDERDPESRRLRRVAPRPGPSQEGWPILGHLTFESRDPIAMQTFYEAAGLRCSEGLGDVFRWLRCNPVHHTLAFSRGPEPRLHHVGIEVRDRAALVDACDRLAQLGQPIEYGPGRHLVGGNIFVYFRDRHGLRFELFCELERLQPDDRPPLIHEGVPRERSVNVWGPQPPESFRDGI